MSVEVEPIDRRILNAAVDDDNDKHGLVEASPSPSHHSSSAGSSLHERTTTHNKLKHPLRASYKEWLHSWFEISVPAIGFLGCQLSLALQNGFVTPELEELGISAKLVNYCWLAPPITGTIVQPLIGITSDMMDPTVEGSFAQKHGRRRPFVALGCAMVVVFLLLFSNARYIGRWLGDDGVTSTSNAAIIAVISFWFLDISINVVQAPLRALVSDIIPTRFHTTANGVFGFANGLGSIIGYGLGYYVAYNPKLGGNLSALFGMAAFTVICTSVLMLYLTRGEKMLPIASTSLSEIIAKNYAQESYHSEVESQQLLGADAQGLPTGNGGGGGGGHGVFISDDNDLIDEQQMPRQHLPQQQAVQAVQPGAVGVGGGAQGNEVMPRQRSESDIDIVLQRQRTKFQLIREAVVNMPLPISRAFAVQFWLFFGLFSSYIYLTDWFGKRVTHGSPESEDPELLEAYRFGVRLASVGLAFGAIFAVFGSMLLPVIIGKFGYRWTWFACMLLYAVMLLMTPFCNTITTGLVIVTCLGIGQAAAMVIGWSIVTETVAAGDQKGLYTTLFTTSHLVPELLVALTAGIIIHLFDDHVSAVLAVGGVAALFGANSALYIVEPKQWLAKQAWIRQHNQMVRNNNNSNRQNG